MNKDAKERKKLVFESEDVRYLYDKEVERSKIIVDKSIAAISLFAADGVIIIFKLKDYCFDPKLAFIALCLVSGILTILSGLSLIFSLAFTSKINTEDYSENNLVDEYPKRNFSREFSDALKQFSKIINGKDEADNTFPTKHSYFQYLHLMNNRKEYWLFFSFSSAAFAFLFEIAVFLAFLFFGRY